MKRLNRLIGIAIALSIGILATYGTGFAETGSNPLTNAKSSGIVGVWDVTVDVYNCNSGAYITSFPAMHKFELGGTGQIVPAGDSPMTPVHMMVWEYLGDNTYSSVIKFFRYDAGGVIGTAVLTNDVWISEDGTEYGGSGISELYDLDGNLLGIAGCPSISGTRFTAGS